MGLKNSSGVGKTEVGEIGVGEMGQIIRETGKGEIGVGETGTNPNEYPQSVSKNKKIMHSPVNPSFTL